MKTPIKIGIIWCHSGMIHIAAVKTVSAQLQSKALAKNVFQ
jgi:hypothetical protein